MFTQSPLDLKVQRTPLSLGQTAQARVRRTVHPQETQNLKNKVQILFCFFTKAQWPLGILFPTPTFLTKYNSFSLDTKTSKLCKKKRKRKNFKNYRNQNQNKTNNKQNKKRDKDIFGVNDGNPEGKVVVENGQFWC